MRKERAGNGRSPAENEVYAKIARQGVSRESELASAAKARAGRRAKAAERIIAREGHLAADVLEREIDREIADQMNRARAAALTARRQAREAADRAAAAEARVKAAEVDNLELDATGLDDAGSDGLDLD